MIQEKLTNIEGVNDYKKDMRTGAILNIDNSALTAYKKRKQSASELKNEINTIREEIRSIYGMLEITLKLLQEKDNK